MSLRRPTVARSLFTFDISPLRDVAQTSDCGTHCHLYSIISPLCGVALTPNYGIVILAFSSRGVIQTLVWHQYYYSAVSARGVIQTLAWPSVLLWDFGRTIARFPFISHALLSHCLSALVNLFICIMFTFVISYVRTVLRVLS